MPDFTGISHVELTVRDADRSAAWYEQVLGMQEWSSTRSTPRQVFRRGWST
jgi:catechol 2,3-dioxygenase-like lactoylglutathione lyase family enzyme